MRTFGCSLFASIIALIFVDTNAQDITGDWYGKYRSADSISLNLHLSKIHGKTAGKWSTPDQLLLWSSLDEIELENDTLFFRISAIDFTFNGYANENFSIISGVVIQNEKRYEFEFRREKRRKIIPLNDNSFLLILAKVRQVQAGNPSQISCTGIRIVRAGNSKIITIDTTKLNVFTPGKNDISNPIIFQFSDQDIDATYLNQKVLSQPAPVKVRAKQPDPILAQPMGMKDAACLNIQILDVEQGLTDSDICSILEDSKGNMWFGSNIVGVCRFDGKFINYYTKTEGLTWNGNRTITEDRYGNIWIGTDWGLCKYDGNFFTQYSGDVFHQILSIFESGNGEIWLGSNIGVFNMKGNIWIHYTENEGLTNNVVRSITEDKNGNLWFGTDSGVCRFNGVSFTHFTENEGLVSNKVRSIIEDKIGNLWFGTDQGASKYDGRSFYQFTIKEGLSNNYINSIREDNNGFIWFGTGEGVNMYDGKTFTHYTVKEGLSNNSIVSIIEDKSKNLWITTYGSGVMKLRRNSFTYFPQLDEIGKGKVTSIIEDRDGNIWFGIYGGGLIKYNGESFTVMTEDEGLSDNNIRSMREDRKGNIWFSNLSGLQKYNGNSITLYYDKTVPGTDYINSIGCIYEDKKGNLWLGTWGEGIRKFDGKFYTCFSDIDNYNEGFVMSILQDSNNDIWYGSIPWGLFKYDGKSLIQYNYNDGLSGTWIFSLYEDKSGNLWIGTQDGGVNKFDGQSFIHFSEEEGLCNKSISSIIEDKKGNIWIGTKKGLSMLSPAGNGSYSITSFSSEDGLKELSFNENSVCLDSRNRLWWGTGDIVTMLDLNTWEIVPKPPIIHLNNIHLNQKYIDFGALSSGFKESGNYSADTNQRVNLRGIKFSEVSPFYNYPVGLKLPHYLNHVSFNFSTIDWTAPQSIRYKYLLEGLDKQWSPLSAENTADYRNIPSGKYVFKVKAISSANLWSETFEYPFKVYPPWWLEWWAYTFYAIVFVLIGWYYLRYRISRERIKAEIRIKQMEVDKMQELDHMKSRFFANISHEFRTPLTLILNPVNKLLENQDKLRENDLELLGTVRRNIGRLQQLINQLLDLSALETGNVMLEVSEGDLTGFVRSIILSFLSLSESRRINFKYNLEDLEVLCFFDEDKIEKILTNLISNAIKFTPEGGSVFVTLNYHNERGFKNKRHARICVKDTGPGITEDEKEKIFDRFYHSKNANLHEHESSGIGLALVSELVELYRGEIHVDSTVGEGSMFTVNVPVSREYFRENEIITVSDKCLNTKFPDDHLDLISNTEAKEEQKSVIEKKDPDRPIILVVEDNLDLRKYISENLFPHYLVLEAENGREGLDIAIESIPDLVISDLMMPEMDGVEMCSRLKKDIRTSHIPLIMLTARADRESKLEGLKTGADTYIIKPFDEEELQVRVKNLIEQRKFLRERYRIEFMTDPAGYNIPPPDDEFLVRVMECLKKHLTESEFNVEHLGKELHLSRVQLYRKLLSLTDYTPSEYIRNIRLKMAARMFQEGYTNISEVLYAVGFNTPSHFTRNFRALFGMNPSEYIKQYNKPTNNSQFL